jgi:hypothetical protein
VDRHSVLREAEKQLAVALPMMDRIKLGLIGKICAVFASERKVPVSHESTAQQPLES